jgi:hypothetical protein
MSACDGVDDAGCFRRELLKNSTKLVYKLKNGEFDVKYGIWI